MQEMNMTVRRWTQINCLILAATLVALAASPQVQAQSVAAEQRALSIQRALERLPRYGVFDFLGFSVDRGTVTLVGYAYDGSLRADAEKAVKRVAGVDEVANRIEVLPASQNDDRIRSATFSNIYTDAFLSRYTSVGPRQVVEEAYEFERYPGHQPFGRYPIRIIVAGGRIRLLGVVDTASDRQLAEVRAREIGGVFEVRNELVIARK
jgi:osmotically-inducible protein OsmY